MYMAYGYGGINLNGWFFGPTGGPAYPWNFVTGEMNNPDGPDGLGWLATLLGWLLLLIIGLALSPLLLGYYFSPHNLSQNKFYWDEIYYALVVWPLKRLAWLSDWCDHWLVDGTVNFLGWLPRAIGSLLRSLQMGLTPFYALAMVLGLVVMLAMGAVWVAG